MPASIAHMMVSRICRERLATREHYREFNEILTTCHTYMDLGSLGPDLPYYENAAKALLNLLLDRSDKPLGVDQWSYQLHSRSPNIFPLKMIEIAWRESDLYSDQWDAEDNQKFAFICGFLTHMAADQIIHPEVNKIAGPYYKAGIGVNHRELHRQVEVYQDVVIFQELCPDQDLLQAALNLWCDICPDSSTNTPLWFRYFIQKAFVEAHSVDGILQSLRFLKRVGPYVNAARDFREQGTASENYKKFYGNINYLSRFEEAVELALIYIQTAFELYEVGHLADDEREFFLSVVQTADLSAP
jgi:hypothetical protein